MASSGGNRRNGVMYGCGIREGYTAGGGGCASERGGIDTAEGDTAATEETPDKAACDAETALYVRADTICPDVSVDGSDGGGDVGLYEGGADALPSEARG